MKTPELFDLDEFKNVDSVYQVRLVKSNNDEGEVLASFKYADHTACMKLLEIEANEELIVTKYTKGKGVTDVLGQVNGRLW
ncbi:MAG: hypothetical protein NE330_15090 [Lentisphaeraceae bacterium]|nr:hypothetical protein [Lentisphaeraceae bacterium]